MVKLIIAGSRHLNISQLLLRDFIKNMTFEIEEIVSGTAKGIDTCGEEFAELNMVKCTKFYPDWTKYGKSAGYIRNGDMASYSDALLLIWDGKSKGSKNMKDQMKCLNKPIYEIVL